MLWYVRSGTLRIKKCLGPDSLGSTTQRLWAPVRAIMDCVLLNLYAEALTPSVTLFGDGSSEDVIEVK